MYLIFIIADKDGPIGVYHPEIFRTEEEARQFRKRFPDHVKTRLENWPVHIPVK
jgi:hypothetical protein